MEIDKVIPHEIFSHKEILKKIFLNIANAHAKKHKFVVSRDLYSVLFVCKGWYRVALPILYSKIIYNGGISRGVCQGTHTQLETLSEFINNNRKQSINFHILQYIRGRKIEEENVDDDSQNEMSSITQEEPSINDLSMLNANDMSLVNTEASPLNEISSIKQEPMLPDDLSFIHPEFEITNDLSITHPETSAVNNLLNSDPPNDFQPNVHQESDNTNQLNIHQESDNTNQQNLNYALDNSNNQPIVNLESEITNQPNVHQESEISEITNNQPIINQGNQPILNQELNNTNNQPILNQELNNTNNQPIINQESDNTNTQPIINQESDNTNNQLIQNQESEITNNQPIINQENQEFDNTNYQPTQTNSVFLIGRGTPPGPYSFINEEISGSEDLTSILHSLEFTEEERRIIYTIESSILPELEMVLRNIRLLGSKIYRYDPMDADTLTSLQQQNNQLLEHVSELTESFYKALDNVSEPSQFKDQFMILFRKLLESIDCLEKVHLQDVHSNPLNDSQSSEFQTSLFVPDLFRHVKILLFNKTDSFRTMEQLYTYKRSYISLLGNCVNLTVLSLGSARDHPPLIMEKDLTEVFSRHSFPFLRYLSLYNLPYISGETAFPFFPMSLTALRVDYCKNVTLEAITKMIGRHGPQLKLLSLKDGLVSVDLLHTLINYCRKLIYVDLSYSKAEKNYVKKVFRTQVQNLIRLNRHLRVFNVYGILDLKNIRKTEQLYPGVRLCPQDPSHYFNQGSRSGSSLFLPSSPETQESDPDYQLWCQYLDRDLHITFDYRDHPLSVKPSDQEDEREEEEEEEEEEGEEEEGRADRTHSSSHPHFDIFHDDPSSEDSDLIF